ncbi:MAG: radical SAM domain-containing protein, partial [Jatrophihabitans sp.]
NRNPGTRPARTPHVHLRGGTKDARGMLRRLERRTRPVDAETREALGRRWRDLPGHVRTSSQLLGRHALGCEGTHGVFPRCNLSCTPCYHSRDANRVATVGSHTVREVAAQFRMLREKRGPRAHAQLIGGEVSLLDPDDHAAALLAMRGYGREPMSMSHGDFDYDYLRRLVLDHDGSPRLRRVSFAGHFDMLMSGRRGLERPADEVALDPARARFTAMFERLRREEDVRSFLAHTMTVTPRNLDQIADVIARNAHLGFGMFSFQPAAFVGDDHRWHESFREVTGDAVWTQIEKGAGTRLPFRALQTGDERCNRTTHGFFIGPDYFPILDDLDPADLRVRDAFLAHLGGMQFAGAPPGVLVLRLARVLARHPGLITTFGGWTLRMVRRVGLRRVTRHPRIRPVTFVMHSFMDADVVAPAWAAMQRNETSSDERVAAAQERLRACSYTMAHPETGALVPACAQHCVLDPAENAALRQLLPLPTRRPDRA